MTTIRPDLSQAVENPELRRALDRLATDHSDAAKDAVLEEIQRASFLVAVMSDAIKIEADDQGDGPATLDQGTEIQVLVAESDGLQFLPLFTDWKAIADYTDLDVTGMVLAAADAWEFALQDGAGYDGAVINPAGNALPLGIPLLQYLRSQDKTAAN